MPRFAANMSFNPIEPLKSKTPLSLQESVKPSELQPVKVTSEVVPEAEFDWNSSGLVNPLDGKFYHFVHLFSANLFLGSFMLLLLGFRNFEAFQWKQ